MRPERFLDFFNSIDADFFCIQESKLQVGQIDLDLPGYHQTGITLRKKAIPAQPFLPKTRHYQCLTA